MRAAVKLMTRGTEAGSGKETSSLISVCVSLLPNPTKVSKREDLGDTCKRLASRHPAEKEKAAREREIKQNPNTR